MERVNIDCDLLKYGGNPLLPARTANFPFVLSGRPQVLSEELGEGHRSYGVGETWWVSHYVGSRGVLDTAPMRLECLPR